MAEGITQLNDQDAIKLLNKLSIVCLAKVALSKGILFNQLDLDRDDTSASIAKQILRVYVKNAFPSGSNLKVLTKGISINLIPNQTRAIDIAFCNTNPDYEKFTVLQYLPKVKDALHAMGRARDTLNNVVEFSYKTTGLSIVFRVNEDVISSGSVAINDYVMGCMVTIDSLKQAIDNLVVALGDIDATVAFAEREKIRIEREKHRQAFLEVGGIISELTGISAYQTMVDDPVDAVVAATTATVTVTPVVTAADDTATVTTAHAHPTAVGVQGNTGTPGPVGTQGPVGRATGRLTHVEEVAPVAPVATVDFVVNGVTPASEDMQERLNRILREQGLL